MKYIVSSNIKYYKNTYTPVVTSLIDSGIQKEDIAIVVGGCGVGVQLENPLGVQVASVEYNSFDLTGLIYVAENSQQFLDNTYFLLHDTCLVGPNFKKLAEDVMPGIPIRTLREGISMNIGMYSLQTLHENVETLNNLKHYPQTEEELQQVKQTFVVNEDILFKHYRDHCYKNSYIGTNSEMVTIDTLKSRFAKKEYQEYFSTLTTSQVTRQMGYSSLLDFYKFQANWQWGSKWKIGV